MFDWLKRFRKKPEVKPNSALGTGEFRVIQNKNTNTHTGYISLLIHDKEVVAQKLVLDGDLYNEIFDYIVNKLGGRIWYVSENDD